MFYDKFINIYLNDLNKLMEFPYFCLSIQLFDVKIKKKYPNAGPFKGTQRL